MLLISVSNVAVILDLQVTQTKGYLVTIDANMWMLWYSLTWSILRVRIGFPIIVVKQNWPRYKRQCCTLTLLYLVMSRRYIDAAFAGCNIQRFIE
jgi:hypothetical protein